MFAWLPRSWRRSPPQPAPLSDLPHIDSRVRVYTRSGCQLCVEVGAMLRRAGIEPEWIDIDDHPHLRSQLDHWVPVVEILGRRRFRGQVNEILLRRILTAELKLDL